MKFSSSKLTEPKPELVMDECCVTQRKRLHAVEMQECVICLRPVHDLSLLIQ